MGRRRDWRPFWWGIGKQPDAPRHARTRSTAVRFRWAGPGAKPCHGRDIGAPAGAGHGSRLAPDHSPGLDPGPRATGTALARLPWAPALRCTPAGLTTGAEMFSVMGAEPRRKSKPDSSGLDPGIQGRYRKSRVRSAPVAILPDGSPCLRRRCMDGRIKSGHDAGVTAGNGDVLVPGRGARVGNPDRAAVERVRA